jgi:hypothetical protein
MDHEFMQIQELLDPILNKWNCLLAKNAMIRILVPQHQTNEHCARHSQTTTLSSGFME